MSGQKSVLCVAAKTYGERKRAPERAFVRALPREGLELNRDCLVGPVEDLPRIVHCLQEWRDVHFADLETTLPPFEGVSSFLK